MGGSAIVLMVGPPQGRRFSARESQTTTGALALFLKWGVASLWAHSRAQGSLFYVRALCRAALILSSVTKATTRAKAACDAR